MSLLTEPEKITEYDIRIPRRFLQQLVMNNLEQMKDGDSRTFVTNGGNILLVVRRTGVRDFFGRPPGHPDFVKSQAEEYDSFDFLWNPDMY
jgi:hypothetical protein